MSINFGDRFKLIKKQRTLHSKPPKFTIKPSMNVVDYYSKLLAKFELKFKNPNKIYELQQSK